VATVRVQERFVETDYEPEDNPLVIATLVTDSKAYMLPEVIEAVRRLRWDGLKVLHVTSNGDSRRAVRMIGELWDGPLSIVHVDLYLNRDNQWHSGAVALLREETRRVLLKERTPAEYVLWLDCDVVIPEDAAVLLREHGQGLVSGVVPSRAQQKIIARDVIGQPLLHPELVQSEGLRKVAMTGFGCLLMRRDVLEKIHWQPEEFASIVDGIGGEDDHACVEAAAAGHPTYLDPQVLCCHYGEDRRGWAAVPMEGDPKVLRTFQMGVAPYSALKTRQKRSSTAGRALWIMASPACHGGVKVCKKMMEAMHAEGWELTVASLNPWEWGAWSDWSFVKRTRPDMIDPPYDLVVANYYATLPIGAKIAAKRHLALIQSDEPEWGILDRKQEEAECFRTPGYQHVIIANHMRCFAEKYGMDIVGQLDNGVDALTFYPDWFLERAWPHSLMMIRKNAPVWFTGQEYAERAVLELAKRYDDLEVVVVGQQAPQWPCKVRHVKTYDQDELRRLLNSVSCYVRPSFIEGFALTDLEAMACGTPLVVTPIGVSDVARHGEEALFCPNIATEAFIDWGRDEKTRDDLGEQIAAGIVENVSRVFEERALREKLALGGLRLVRERTWERQQAQWMEIVERVMAECEG
jgi:glycosyltransferase involved in cell wall biosynthesis